MSYSLLFILALSPSIIWLLFFLRKDAHPESNPMILKIFFYGILAALPAVLIELGILNIFEEFSRFIHQSLPSFIFVTTLSIFLSTAFVEEFLKYLVVKEKILNDPEFDEPIDAMLYMIIAALGFAAFENILILFPLAPTFLITGAVTLSVLRFIGATLLHALCSGFVGYFLALSFFRAKLRGKLVFLGLGIVILLHALYNFSIITLEGNIRFIVPGIILITLALIISLGFKKLKGIVGICEITTNKIANKNH